MEYQTFRGSDVKEALSAVKAALGPDAMIGSTRFVGGSVGHNHSYVEVLAAQPQLTQRGGPFARGAHAQAPVVLPPTRRRPTSQGSWRMPDASGIAELEEEGVDQSKAGGVGARDMAALERELATMKAMLAEIHATRPPKEQAQAMLSGLGVEGALARELAGGAGRNKKKDPRALREWLKGQIIKRFPVAPGLINGPGKQVVACIGPTGVGKTTTLAKLAAKARLDLGKSVGVISLDTFRVGAVEQWQRYADLMGLSIHVASDPESFRRALSQDTAELLLIDTPGHVGKAQADWPIARCLDSVTGRRLDTLLVLPAWMRAHDVEQLTRDYDPAHPTGLVATKVDEASRVGGVLHSAAVRGLPFTYICDGPRVPEDIHDATDETLLAAIFDR